MLNQGLSPTRSTATFPGGSPGRTLPGGELPGPSREIGPGAEGTVPLEALDDNTLVEWSEEDIVFLHWRLLKGVGDLRDPETPLEEKLDILRWVFAERDKDALPFSFANCLKVVGCSPLSPAPYFGPADAEEIREAIRDQVQAWLNATLERYPSWVREAVLKNPEWVERRLETNPQWLNEQIRKHTVQGDLFA